MLRAIKWSEGQQNKNPSIFSLEKFEYRNNFFLVNGMCIYMHISELRQRYCISHWFECVNNTGDC